jgi:hypothetical protein
MLYAFELPDGTKKQLEMDPRDCSSFSHEVRKLLPKIKRGEYSLVDIKVYKVEIIDLEIKLTPYKNLEVEPFTRAMTPEDFALDMEKLLSEIPEEFRAYVRDQAYERGHSSGYEDTYNVAQDIVSGLVGPIKEYTKRLVRG